VEWREKKAAVDQAAAPLSLRAKMLMFLRICQSAGVTEWQTSFRRRSI
jgi:hypothetical protein